MTSSKMFIQIGYHFINIHDIIEVYPGRRDQYDKDGNRIDDVETIRMITRRMVTNGDSHDHASNGHKW